MKTIFRHNCEFTGGTEWYIVEQEIYPLLPMECARRCVEKVLQALPSFARKPHGLSGMIQPSLQRSYGGQDGHGYGGFRHPLTRMARPTVAGPCGGSTWTGKHIEVAT